MPDDTPIPDKREEEDDRPRRRRRRDDDDFEEDRPRGRRRVEENSGDGGLQFVVPVNTSGLAIAAGYMGLISVLCLPAPISLILGILALRHLKKNPKMHGHARAIFAIVMGVIFTVLPISLLAINAMNNP
jgi:hypothetical protein